MSHLISLEHFYSFLCFFFKLYFTLLLLCKTTQISWRTTRSLHSLEYLLQSFALCLWWLPSSIFCNLPFTVLVWLCEKTTHLWTHTHTSNDNTIVNIIHEPPHQLTTTTFYSNIIVIIAFAYSDISFISFVTCEAYIVVALVFKFKWNIFRCNHFFICIKCQ